MRIVLLLALCFASPTFALDTARTAYFADFPFWESPIQPVKFEVPLGMEEAKGRIHVKVEYDAADRIVDMQVRQGDDFKELGNSYGAMYVHAVHTTIAYSDGKETHQFFNRFGHQIFAWGKVWQKVYTKDAKGRFTKLEFFDLDGKPVENSWGILRYEWEHQLDGSVIEVRLNKDGDIQPHRPGWEFKRIRLVFGSDGHLSTMQNIDDKGQLLQSASGAAQYSYYYESMGKFQRWEIYDTNGKPALGPTKTAGEFYTHDRTAGKKITFFDQEGRLTVHHSGATHWQIINDQYGNMIERSFYDQNDKSINGQYGYAKLVQIWDHKGKQIVSKKLFDQKNKPAAHIDGYHKIQFIYDDRGLLKEQRFMDLDGELIVSAYEKAAIMVYEYDAHGSRIKTVKLDTKRRPMAKLGGKEVAP